MKHNIFIRIKKDDKHQLIYKGNIDEYTAGRVIELIETIKAFRIVNDKKNA